ncbi:hypothetical protein SAMD00019534_068300 [Acytostelium subglobosum LB1]|uniref:hypothetical protein n=1 Tax=Acytostelium subglobosum LB1 TaxID=1410327 RepID=UPI000644FFD1|nr:hypothetical protein SAMD00019534_068300 [Acytostelium subglobosum LB1]GAM23655.1 hypothetical protein SAMD00019534_068300 [Acytostelium subglobosum LB1]|eukprot:XP_012753396.1 hypothetical protein SAMD00019534_068300 [Acytostelium subglobosum LB1]
MSNINSDTGIEVEPTQHQRVSQVAVVTTLNEPISTVTATTAQTETLPISKNALKKEMKRLRKEEHLIKHPKGPSPSPVIQQGSNFGHLPPSSQGLLAPPCPSNDSNNNNNNNNNNNSKNSNITTISIADINESLIDQRFYIVARLQSIGRHGKNLALIKLRDFGTSKTIQGVASTIASSRTKTETTPTDTSSTIESTRNFIRFIGHLNKESIVHVEVTVTRSEKPVETCTITNLELVLHALYVSSATPPNLPLTYDSLEIPSHVFSKIDSLEYKAKNTPLSQHEQSILALNKVKAKNGIDFMPSMRYDNRVLDLRGPSSKLIFKVQSSIGLLFRDRLNNRDFIEIHTPRVVHAPPDEHRGPTFRMQYLDELPAQLIRTTIPYRQMVVLGDMHRVYEVGPVFRADQGKTFQHLTEYTSMDVEMVIERDYHDILNEADTLIRSIVEGLNQRYASEAESFKEQFEFEPLEFGPNQRTLVLTLDEAKTILVENGEAVYDYDLMVHQKRMLYKFVKERYGVDYFILDKFPLDTCAFYVMANHSNSKQANYFELIIRGLVVATGSQHIHDLATLKESARKRGLRLETTIGQHYLDSFQYGSVAHGGFSIGLERLTMAYLNLTNVRRSSMFPRDDHRLKP